MIKLPPTPIELKRQWARSDLEAALERYNTIAVGQLKLEPCENCNEPLETCEMGEHTVCINCKWVCG